MENIPSVVKVDHGDLRLDDRHVRSSLGRKGISRMPSSKRSGFYEFDGRHVNGNMVRDGIGKQEEEEGIYCGGSGGMHTRPR